MNKPYKPVSCDLIDKVEIWATYKKDVLIRYKDAANQELEVKTIITTWTNDGTGEYILTKCGLRVRLDRVVSMAENS